MKNLWGSRRRLKSSFSGPVSAVVLCAGLLFSALGLATTQPSSMSVVIPVNTNNAAGAGAYSCTLSGGSLSCTGTLSSTESTDDITLTGITFSGTTFDGTAGEIIPGLASIFLSGGGGTNVNAEWGDDDNNDDTDDNPFDKSGYPIASYSQETSDVDIINATLLEVFKSLNIHEGIDGEDQDFRIRLAFEAGVVDNDGSTTDSVPEIIVFERGLNSDVALTLLLQDGGESDELFVSRNDFRDTGIEIDTVEIGGGQQLGVVGVDLNEFSGTGFDAATDTVIGVRFGSAGGGADVFGVFGVNDSPVDLDDWGDAPDSYGTDSTDSGGEGVGPSHVLNNEIFLGTPPDTETDGQPSSDAGDDGADEDGTLTFPTGSFGAGDTFSVDVLVTNLTGGSALVCGWIDFNDDGEFDNATSTSGATNAERACATAADGSISTGDTPDTVTLDFVIPNDFADSSSNLDEYAARFRITTDWANAAASSPHGSASDGEVEDVIIENSTLPVSVSAFSSRYTERGLEVTWRTVSETHNAAFTLWGDSGKGLQLLTEQPVASKSLDPVAPNTYQLVLDHVAAGQVKELALTAIDYFGAEAVYGVYQAGEDYGRRHRDVAIDWQPVQQAQHKNLEQKSLKQGNQPVQAVDVSAATSGMVAVTWQALKSRGLDLSGVPYSDITVTLMDQPVARDIQATNGQSGSQVFGPGQEIRFWVQQPAKNHALYIDRYRYRISGTDGAGQSMQQSENIAGSGPGHVLQPYRVAENTAYHFSSPMADPWYAARLQANSGNDEYTVVVNGTGRTLPEIDGEVSVTLGGLTDFPESPDHSIQVQVNGQVVGNHQFDGNSAIKLSFPVPAQALASGQNTVTVVAAGNTAAPFDVMLVDSVTLSLPQAVQALNHRLQIAQQHGINGLTVRGLQAEHTVAYGHHNGQVYRYPVSSTNVIPPDAPVLFVSSFEQADQTTNDQVLVSARHTGETEIWVSRNNALLSPDVLEPVYATMLEDTASADLLIIAHPNFMPESRTAQHALNTYRDWQQSRGWSTALVDITAIQQHYTGSMPLPDAVNHYLADAKPRIGFTHVLLIGSDSYDYRDTLGLGSINFIPTHYTATHRINHTPVDAQLADINGDGLSDVALGRWPVRIAEDLDSIVQKTMDYAQMPQQESAIWVTDHEDKGGRTFFNQAQRMLEPLMAQQWPLENLHHLALDDVSPLPGMTGVETARRQLFDALENGQTMTGFVGHGAPTMWTFHGLLAPQDLHELNNEGTPTLITTMTCYTSYFVSPYNDTVAHRWMNGYKENMAGHPVAGATNGAAAIHGASTLSSYTDNEVMARWIVKRQLAGDTLGEAVNHARNQALKQGMIDQAINWTLLGDPTIQW